MPDYLLPDVGEGLTEAEIVEWRVAPGDRVALNQVIVEIETAKSLVELPSPFAGVVGALLAEAGQTVDVGAPIVRIIAESDAESDAGADAAADTHVASDVVAEGSGSLLVGYGTSGHATSRRRRGSVAATAPARPEPGRVLAKPPIRKLAKDLGLEIGTVNATGATGEVTREDVIRESEAVAGATGPAPGLQQPREERIPVKGMRKAIAAAMVASTFTAPHVSVFVDVDATRTMELVRKLKVSSDFEGVRVSPLLIAAKAVSWAVRRNPMVNSTLIDDEIIVRHYVNLGIAAATPRGLIVPNIKDAQDLSLRDLATALDELVLTAKEGRTSPAEMANGTITITNLGSFGMDTGTPILNPGEVGIVALGSITQKPWVVDGEVRPRYVTTLAGSFDHRVVDGDVMSRFLADVASVLEEPALLIE